MSGIYTLRDLRSLAPPELRNAPDSVLINEYAKDLGADPTEVARYFGYNNSGGMARNRIAAGVDNYQANMYGLGGAVARKVGADRIAGWMDQRREANELDAATATLRARELGAVDDWREVDGIRSGANYIGGLLAQSAPYLAEATAGGIVVRGVMTGTRRALAVAQTAQAAQQARRALNLGSMGGAAAASYPSAVGHVLSAQRDAGAAPGEERLGSAMLGGVPYAALSAIGAEGVVARGLRPIAGSAEHGMARRMATEGLKTSLTGGTAETLQEGINQYYGRMAVNPEETLFNDEANKRYLDSFIGGAALGGTLGSLGGIRRPIEEFTPTDLLERNRPAPAQPQLDPQPTFDTDREVGLGIIQPINPYDVGGYVTRFQQGGETDIDTPQVGLLGGGAGSPAIEVPNTPSTRTTATPASKTKTFSPSEQALIDRGITPSGKKVELYEDAVAAGLDLESDTLSPFWTALTENKFKQAKKALAEALIETRKQTELANAVPQPAAPAQPSVSLPGQPASLPATAPAVVGVSSTQGVVSGAQAPQAQQASPQKPQAPAPAASGTAAADQAPAAQPVSDTAPTDILANRKAAPVKPAPVESQESTLLVDPTEAMRYAEILRATGRESDANAVDEAVDQVTGNVREAPVADDATIVQRVLEERFKGSKDAERDKKLLAVFAAVSRNVGKGLRGKLKDALGADFGVGRKSVDKIGNPAELVRAGESLGYSKEQVLQAFGFESVREVGASESTAATPAEERGVLKAASKRLAEQIKNTTGDRKLELEAQKRQLDDLIRGVDEGVAAEERGLMARALRDAGFEFEDGELSGFVMDDDGSWRKLGKADSAEVKLALDVSNKIDSLLALIDELGSELPASVEFLRDLIAQEQAKVAEAFAKFQPKVEGPKVELSEAHKAAKQRLKDAKGDVTKLPDEDLPLIRDEYARFNNREGVEATEAEMSKRGISAAPAPAPKAKAPAAEPAPAPAPAAKEKPAKAPATKMPPGQKLWETLVNSTPGLKAYGELDATQRGALDDIVAKYGPNVTLKNPSLSTLVADSMVGEGDAKYGKGGMATDPYTAKELLAELKRFVRADIPGRKLIVVDSVVDLLLSSDPALQRLGAALSVDRAYGVAADGRAVLVANRIQKGQGRAKFMHEVGVHIGLENLLPKPVYDRLVKQVKDWAESDADTDEVTLAARAVLRVERAGTPDADRDAELLAYFVEEAVKAGIDPTAEAKLSGPLRDWFRTLWAAFKVALHKLGMKPEALTAQDVVDLAFGAARLEIAGTRNGISAETRMRFGKDLDAFAKPATRAQVEQTLAKLPAPLRNNVRTVWSTLREYGSRALDRAVFTADLLDRATKAGIKSAKTYQALMAERGAKAREHELRVEAIADLYQAIPSMEEGARANELARESTRTNQWAYQPEWLDSKVKVDPDLAAQWDKLHPASRKWIDAMFRFEHEMLQRKRKMVLDNAASTYDAMIRAAQEAIDSGNLEGYELKAAKQELAKAKRDKVNELKRFERLFELRSNSPYLPLKRFGRWAVVAKSEEYRAAEAAGDAATLRKLEQSGDHYYVDFAESLFEANVMRDKLEAEFGAGSTQRFEREEFRNIYGSEGMLATMTKLRNIIDAQPVEGKGDRTALRRMQSMLSEMYLQALAETSARKSEMRRKGVAGDMDMLRSFTTQGNADALFLSAVEYNDRIQDSIQSMRRETRLVGDRLRASGLFNEIVRRYDQSLVYDPSPITQKITRMTSMWFLASSPGYYIQNLTQPYMMSVPMMAGRHGWAEAAKAQFEAYSQLGPVLKTGTATTGFDFSRVPADVRDAVDYLVKRGLVDIGLDTELGEFRTDGESRAKAAWNKVDKFLRVSTQKLEAINRLSTAIAAYRLELAKGGDKAAAMDYAAKVINDTHGDYTAFNAPRVFNTNFGKIALQFRKFQLIQLTLLAKLFREAGFSTQEKRAALASLGFVLGHTAIMAGAMGLPGYAAIAWAVNGLFGDDDEPFDLTQKIRQAIGDEHIANLIMRGAPTLLGADMSGKVGMGTALSVLPFTDVDLLDRRSSAEVLGTLVGGASFGLFQRMADGVALISNGDYYKGIEMLMPKGITDVMKAARIASDGVTRRNGDVLLPASEVSAVESIMQGLGVPVVKQTVRSERQQYVYDTARRMDEASTKIKNDYAKAARKRDTQAMREARQRWDQLQKNRKEAGLRVQPLSSLLQAPQKQAERERNTVRGVQFNANNRGLVEALW